MAPVNGHDTLTCDLESCLGWPSSSLGVVSPASAYELEADFWGDVQGGAARRAGESVSHEHGIMFQADVHGDTLGGSGGGHGVERIYSCLRKSERTAKHQSPLGINTSCLQQGLRAGMWRTL